jgi:predicted dienelactone hydrolase
MGGPRGGTNPLEARTKRAAATCRKRACTNIRVMNTNRRQLILAGTALGLAPWQPAFGAALPEPLDGQWPDPDRARTLPWRLRLPAGAGPWPLVLHSHGLGGSREGGAVWGRAWAEAGLAVLHLQHPGSDSEVLRSGLRQLRQAASPEQLLARVQDVRSVLDQCARRAAASEAPWAALRLDAVGLSGHSFGAVTTQAVAGQRFPAGAPLDDLRPRAFIAFSPSLPRGGQRTPQQAFGAITRPLLAVTGSHDGDPFGQGDSRDNGEPRARVYDGLPPGQRALLWLDGADHMTFGGGTPRRVPSVGPFQRIGAAAEQEPRHHALVARLTTLWWRAQLLGDADAAAALRQPQALGPGDRWVLG